MALDMSPRKLVGSSASPVSASTGVGTTPDAEDVFGGASLAARPACAIALESRTCSKAERAELEMRVLFCRSSSAVHARALGGVGSVMGSMAVFRGRRGDGRRRRHEIGSWGAGVKDARSRRPHAPRTGNGGNVKRAVPPFEARKGDVGPAGQTMEVLLVCRKHLGYQKPAKLLFRYATGGGSGGGWKKSLE